MLLTILCIKQYNVFNTSKMEDEMLKTNLILEQQAATESAPPTITDLLLTTSVLLYILQKISRGRRKSDE